MTKFKISLIKLYKLLLLSGKLVKHKFDSNLKVLNNTKICLSNNSNKKCKIYFYSIYNAR